MRLKQLENSHRLRQKLLLLMMGLIMRRRVPDVVRTLLYRPEFFGNSFSRITHSVMRLSRGVIALDIVRMDDCVPLIGADHLRTGIDAQKVGDVGRNVDLVGSEIPIPQTFIGTHHGERISFLALLERRVCTDEFRLGLFLIGNVLLRADSADVPPEIVEDFFAQLADVSLVQLAEEINFAWVAGPRCY